MAKLSSINKNERRKQLVKQYAAKFEKLKASFRENPLGKAWAAGPGKLFETIRAPRLHDDLPGRHRN